jgi:hypothetical protein
MVFKIIPELLGEALYTTAQLVLSNDKSFSTLSRIEAVKTLACQYYESYSKERFQIKQAHLKVYSASAKPQSEKVDVLFAVHKSQNVLLINEDTTILDPSLPFLLIAVKFVA